MNRYRRRDAASLLSLTPNHPLRIASKRITQLTAGFFGLSVLFFVLAAIADAQQPESISIYVWGRVVTELILGAAYFLFAYLFRRGKFWGYLRLLMTSALALLSAASVVILEGSYPWWIRAEQALQCIVVVSIVSLLIQRAIRTRFRNKETQ